MRTSIYPALRLRSLALCCCLAALAGLEARANSLVPVMIWQQQRGGVAPELDLLKPTTRSELDRLLEGRLAGSESPPPLVVFYKDDLCLEDISAGRQYLQQFNESQAYLAPALDDFTSPASYERVDAADFHKMEPRQLAVVSLAELSEIPARLDEVRNAKADALVVLTGKSCRYGAPEQSRRSKRAADGDDVMKFKINGENGNRKVLFYAMELPILEVKNSSVTIQQPTSRSYEWNEKEGTSTLSFDSADYKFKLNFVKQNNWYTLAHISLSGGQLTDAKLISSEAIHLPNNFSYFCARGATFRNAKEDVSLRFKGLLVQMDVDGFSSEVYDCVGFMSAPIWTGIFVVAIMALIMIWGLTMIMDIHTMDRFDDPKGKTITISAQE